MKRTLGILVLLALAVAGAAAPAGAFGPVAAGRGEIPAALDNYVNDYAGLIPPADRTALSARLGGVESQTGIEITVVTVPRLAAYGGGDVATVARMFFNVWGVGNVKSNDGILILVAREDRRMAIEVGDGWGRVLRTRLEALIRTDFAPYFKENRFPEGIAAGTAAVVDLVTRPREWYERKWVQNLGFVLAILFCVSLAWSCFTSGRTGWGWFFLAMAFGLLYFLMQNNRSRGSSSSFGGGHSSGGGGASGGW